MKIVPCLRILIALTAITLLPCPLAAQTNPKNILLIVADEIGTDALSLYNTNTGPNVSFAPTPNIDALAQRGVTFRNCYGYPSCSPTRSAILTGRYGFRTGIGAAHADPGDPVLSARDFTIAKALSANPQLGIRHAQIGKWHLSTNAWEPNTIGGWSHYSGFLAGERTSYYDWEKTVNGVTTHATNYATSENATDAINWIAAQGTNRWFLWFAPKSAHSPYDKPPNALHSYDYLSDIPGMDPVQEYWEAILEALDTELGRVLTNINFAETMVVFIGDNGTPSEVIQPPFDSFHCKGTLSEGGVRVPLIIAGAGVVATNRSTPALVHAVDLFSTLLEFAGVNVSNTLPTNLVFDSRSFAPVVRNEPWTPAENVILMENFGSIIPPPLRGVAARGLTYKVLVLDNGNEALYDLQNDPFESNNLLAGGFNNLTVPQRAAYIGLTNRLSAWHNPPNPTPIIRWEKNNGPFTVTVPEQLGIRYGLVRAPVVTSSNWSLVPNQVIDIPTNAARVTLTDPTPPAGAFYRVIAAGR